MRKQMLILLLLALGRGLMPVRPAMAANVDSFSNVPLGDWSYTAVETLVQAGLAKRDHLGGDYGHAYSPDREITRFEMANIVIELAGKRTKTPEQAALVEKLLKAYEPERKKLGRQVRFEKKMTGRQKFTVSGGYKMSYIRNDYTVYDVRKKQLTSNKPTNDTMKGRVDMPVKFASELILGVKYKINDDWQVGGEIDAGRDVRTNATYNDNYPLLYVQGKGGRQKEWTFHVGRFNDKSPSPWFESRSQAAVFDNKLMGARVNYKDRSGILWSASYGKVGRGYGSKGLMRSEGDLVGLDEAYLAARNTTDTEIKSDTTKNQLYKLFDYAKFAMVAPLGPNASVQLATHHASDVGPYRHSVNLREAGFGFRFNKKLRFMANYAASDMDYDNKLYGAALKYGNLTNSSKKGDYMWKLYWAHLEQYSFFDSNYNMTHIGVPGTGWGLEYARQISDHSTLSFGWEHAKATKNRLLDDATNSQIRGNYWKLIWACSFGADDDDIDILKD